MLWGDLTVNMREEPCEQILVEALCRDNAKKRKCNRVLILHRDSQPGFSPHIAFLSLTGVILLCRSKSKP